MRATVLHLRDLREPVLANGSHGQYRLAAPGRLIKIDQIVINPAALSQTKRGFSGNVKRWFLLRHGSVSRAPMSGGV
jgi:hypothetical protein